MYVRQYAHSHWSIGSLDESIQTRLPRHAFCVSPAQFGCLPFTQKIRKFRMECKWKDEFCLPERTFSRDNGIS